MDVMDFMDSSQRKRHDVMLMVGYVLVAIAILLLTTILVFVAYGFGYKNGQVIQNGLVFLSTAPGSAQIDINGVRYQNSTNTRIALPAGTYNFDLKRSGYRDWQRSVVVQGGDVQRYDYPFLFPVSLTATTKQDYAARPVLTTESPDRRWLIVARPNSFTSLDIYDLNDTKKLPTVVSLPAGLLSAGEAQSLQLVEWSNDNTHSLIKHAYGGNAEYILFDRSSPEKSVNLTRTLALAATGVEVQLANKKYDRYYIFETAKHTLSRATLSAPQATVYLNGVLTYKSYGDKTVLYVTSNAADANKVDINLFDGNNTYTIRHDAVSATYLLDLTTFDGSLYVATSASGENLAYVYKDPVGQITNKQLGIAVPVRAFRITTPNYVSFSANAQYVVFESGAMFGVYDAENEQGYTFTAPDTLDAPQVHAAWMDGARLLYVSGGQLVVMDYDGTNRQVLVSADPAYQQYFDQSYKFLYAFAPSASNKSHELLTSTGLRTSADQ